MVSDNKAASMFFLKEKAVCFGALGCRQLCQHSGNLEWKRFAVKPQQPTVAGL